jgi:hypothetical protein
MKSPRALVSGLVLAALLAGAVQDVQAQVASYLVSRQKWLSQLGTNPVPVMYRFSSMVVGNGLKKADLNAPTASYPLAGGSYQMMFGTNYPAWIFSGTNLSGGLEEFNAQFGPANYNLYTEAQLSVVPIKKTYACKLTNEFPQTDPVFTNVGPLSTLAPTQVFQWPAFSSDPAAYVRFVLLEGAVNTNMIEQIATEGITSVTNTLAVVTMQPKLPATQTSFSVSGINPALDHLALLEFCSPNPLSDSTTVGSEVSSFSANITFFFALRIVTQPISQKVAEGDFANFTVLAIGATPITYQWQFNGKDIVGATNALLILPSVKPSDAGEYRAIATNPAGSETSLTATLEVTPPEPDQALKLSEMHMQIDGSFRFLVSGDNWVTAMVQGSTDLVAWQDLQEVSAGDIGAAYYFDSGAASKAYRFYRAKQLK